MRRGYIVIALTTFLAGYIANVDGQGPQPVEAPSYSVGDQWTYKDMFASNTIAVVEVGEGTRVTTNTK